MEASQGGGWKSGSATLPSESVLVPGVDGERQRMFSETGLLDKELSNISDHLSL